MKLISINARVTAVINHKWLQLTTKNIQAFITSDFGHIIFSKLVNKQSTYGQDNRNGSWRKKYYKC